MFLRKNDKLEALIGPNSELSGDLRIEGTLRIDGACTGNIVADWVIVGDGASIKGDIAARGVVIGGTIHGTIKAQDIVEIKPKGQLLGDIHTKKLTVAEGGMFEGRSYIQRDEVKVIDFEGKKALSP